MTSAWSQFVCLLVAAAVLVACDRAPGTGAASRAGGMSSEPAHAASSAQAPSGGILTTFYPTAYFAERIAAGAVPVRCLLPSNADPAIWQPGADCIREYQQADLIVLNGAGLEKWSDSAALPLNRIVDTTSAFKDEFIQFPGVTHAHGAGGMHSHVGVDCHTWMDPVLARRQVDAIRVAMTRRWPEHRERFEKGAAALSADLAGLHEQLDALETELGRVTLLANHPAYGYLARRHGLTITTIDIDPETALVPDQLQVLDRAVNADSAKPVVMFFESAPIASIKAEIARIGVHVTVYAPCESPPSDQVGAGQDFLTIMRRNLEGLAHAVRSNGGRS